jgi:hypothetical protein
MNEELKVKLVSLGLNEEQVGKLFQAGLTSEDDMKLLSPDEIKNVTECGLVTAKKVHAAIVTTNQVPSTGAVSAAALDVLPVVPTDENWLSALKVGGTLKFNENTVIGTVSAALAAKVGLYNLPERIIQAMEENAQALQEPVGEEFYALQKSLTQRSYAEIFAALPGVTGRFATEGRKKELLARINERLWSSLASFNQQLKGWVTSWQQGAANPAAMLGMFAMAAGGGGQMPPGVMDAPPADTLRDAADSVIDSINYVFAGTGIPVAMALAYDAQEIRKVLDNATLPSQIGVANREQMLKKLRAAVSSDYPRLERNIKQYVLGVINLKNITPGRPELQYLVALYQLGVMIDFEKVASGNSHQSGIGRL